MFSDATSAPEVAERFENYKGALSGSHQKAASSGGTFVPGQGIVQTGQGEQIAARVEAITKGLAPDALASVQGELDALKGVTADLGKDWSLTFPNSSGLVPYDLEAPAKLLVPRMTPLRNSIPRGKGVGTARQFRRILGWTNSSTGGVSDAMAFMNSETITNTFGGVSGLRRGNKITYASDSKSVTYVEQGLSDSVTWRAQFAGQGYQDIRSLSQTALLWATMGAEERALLFGRGAAGNGYAGAVSAPTISVASQGTGGAVAAGTYYIKVTARAGGGESVASTEVSTGALTGSTNQFTITVTSEPTGALGYNIYIGTSSGAETFVASFAGNTVTVTTTPVGGGAAVPGADSTANTNGYDGFLTVQADPAQSGYVKRVNAKIYNSATPSSSLGDTPFQDAFVSLYGAGVNPGGGSGQDKRLADPDEIWCDGNIRRALGDFVKSSSGGAAGYRIALTEGDATGGVTVGSVVSGIQNQTTGRYVDLNVHPYMPVGCALIRSRTLPVPDSEVSNTSEVINVQDYMSIEWPVVQFTYDQSTYLNGTFVHYAPAWSGMLIGCL
ncbi:hypothetical protein EBO15_01480 [Actinomadura harenae]|uniref:Uncharacterized protein n=2 Tax=Actinomadura harenae TaxID=2483351 RepID=A0A3M2MF01_9ACTN|nr:hypothetical protein EBO15_01480 [Actinomadura harenae]